MNTSPTTPQNPTPAVHTSASPSTDGGAANTAGDTSPAKKSYKDTLNLPKTPFAMKANLVQNEPASLKRWQAIKLYDKVRASKVGKPKFVFHDGPPYANGNLHLGHLLNKCLKDFVVRARGMMGFDCPYVPGWDCHGLPIEHKVMTDLQEKGKLAKLATLADDQRKMAVRRECQAHAEKYVKLQRGQMERFLTLADYDHPYLTMQPSFEGATLEVLAKLCEQGLVYRALKPVHWSIANETALAEAELEYYDREDLSVYVDFEAVDADAVYDAFGLKAEDFNSEGAESAEEEAEGDEVGEKAGKDAGEEAADGGRRDDSWKTPKSAAPAPGTRPLVRPSFMIWTTTPWTLPANLAIAVNPKFEYACVWVDGAVTVMAADAVARVMKMQAADHPVEEFVVLGTCKGEQLLGLKYNHPFMKDTDGFGSEAFTKDVVLSTNATDAVFSILSAEYVTLEDGTGLVHTAPGHGQEDYLTGNKHFIPPYCPVRADGTYDATVPEWLRGVSIWKANDQIAELLRDSGHLFYSHKFTHSYPHDWRSKTPVIFRCTNQWFVGVGNDKKFTHETDAKDSDPKSLRERAVFSVPVATASSGHPELRNLGKDATTDYVRALLPKLQNLIKESAEDHVATVLALLPELRYLSKESAEDHLGAVRAFLSGVKLLSYQGLDQEQSVSAFMQLMQETGGFNKQVKFIPSWGANRMRGMLESRPDWCISRQRAWGIPIPAFYLDEHRFCMTPDMVRAVAKVIREQGTNCWFTLQPKDLLKHYDRKHDPLDRLFGLGQSHIDANETLDLNELKKSNDILDVWFESGSTWNACMRERRLGFPCDLYLEGSDQHRGWFQSSLLTSLGVTGVPPFKTLLTHGFIVDKDGKKLSKSRADAARYEVESLCNEFGMDVMRWWVASAPYENDIKADLTIFTELGESYRKVRNTLRFMLSNLYDYEPGAHGNAPLSERGGTQMQGIPPTSLDAWVLGEFDKLSAMVEDGYENYDFRIVHQSIYDFCNDTLSAVYLAAVKDRLYCDRPDSARRRRTQAALWNLTDGLCRLLAPLMCHTADEAYRALLKVDAKETESCVHLHEFVRHSDTTGNSGPGFGVNVSADWADVLNVRDAALQAIEQVRKEKGVDTPLEVGVTLPDPEGKFATFDPVDLADLLGVSRVALDRNAKTPSVIDLRSEARCERSWKRDGTVRKRTDGGMLSDRDAEAVGV